MRIFVPVEDAPSDASLAMLVPYRCGFICEHGMREALQSAGQLPEGPADARKELDSVAAA